MPGGGGGSDAVPPFSSGVMLRIVTRRLMRARSVGLLFQVLLAIALRGQVFRRHAELLRQQCGRGFGAAIRQRQIVDVGADRVGMALDQEYRARVGRDRAVEPVGDRLQLRRLIGGDFPRSGFEVDAVEVDARHALAHRGAVADFVERIATFDPLHRRRDHGVVEQLRRRVVGLDDVAIPRNAKDRRRADRHRSRRRRAGRDSCCR